MYPKKRLCLQGALHPAGSDREGQSRKDLWPPEGSADLILGDRDPLVKMLMEIAATPFALSQPSSSAQLF